MEYLIHFIANITNNPGQAAWIFSATIGVAIFLFGLGIAYLVAGAFDPLRRRLHTVVGVKRSGPSLQALTDAVEPIGHYVLPKAEKELSGTKAELRHAGYRSDSAVTMFYAIKMLIGLAFPIMVIIGASFYPGFSTQQVVVGALVASFIGLLLPNVILSRKVAKRQLELKKGFPDALDLLVACTEAGMGLNAALQRVADELVVSYPALGEELALVMAQMRAGVDRVEALQGLSERTGLEEIRGLVSALSQSLRFGTSIADTLRIYSEEFRDKRMQHAEEQAAKIGTKMIFPLVLCMFPGFFVVAVGPAILHVLRVFQG